MTEQVPLQFRRARLDDLAKVSRLERRIWLELAASYGDLRRRFLLFPQAFQLAVREPEIAGFCCGLLSDRDAGQELLNEAFPHGHVPGGQYLFLVGLSVNPLFRRKGIASTLVCRQAELAKKLRCQKVQLIANAFSKPLFERQSFRVVKHLDRLFEPYRELMPEPVLMERTIS